MTSACTTTKARVYSPTLGRYLQTDPIGYDDQINLGVMLAMTPSIAIRPKAEFEPEFSVKITLRLEFSIRVLALMRV